MPKKKNLSNNLIQNMLCNLKNNKRKTNNIEIKKHHR